MNEKQRIKSLIHFNSTDLIPWQINYTSQMAEKLLAELGLAPSSGGDPSDPVSRYLPLDDFLGNHIAYVRNRSQNSLSEVGPGVFKDEWNVLWDRRIDKDIGTPVNCLLESGNLDRLLVPDANEPARYAHLRPIIESNANRYILAKFSYSLFERAWSLRGMENLFIDFIQNPSFVDELFGTIRDFNLAVMKNLTRYPIDGIYFGDDWGSQKALLMSPDMWRRFIRPHLKEMYDQAHAQGYDVFIHSCGEISSLLEDLIGVGLNVFNPFQPEVMNIERVMQRYSGRLAFYGSVSIQQTLPYGTEDDVRSEIENRLSAARRYGGLIISPSHDMPPDIAVGNVLAMREKLREQAGIR